MSYSSQLTFAAVQMVSSGNLAENLKQAEKLIKQACKQGANLVVLPEFFAIMGIRETDKLACQENHGKGQVQDFLARIADELNIWLVGGTHPIKSGDCSKPYSRCYVYAPGGKCVTWYDKIHLFDVTVNDLTKNYCESRYATAGSQVVSFDSPWGKVGLAVCYDLRFPELFRQLTLQGIKLVVVPAAFTYQTGKAHWEILLRARAIENQLFVAASAQGGLHENGRETWGHSCIISPFGEILAQKSSGIGFVCSHLDFSEQQKLRESFPVLTHTRL